MLDINQMRKAVQTSIEDDQARDCYAIGEAMIYWVQSGRYYHLMLPTGDSDTQDRGCGDLISLISDQDIESYYNEEIA